jgi:hypothetical protein
MFCEIDTADVHGPGRGPEIVSEDAQHRALARAVRPIRAGLRLFPFFDGEGYATHGKAATIALHTLDEKRSRAVRRPRGPFTANNFYPMSYS